MCECECSTSAWNAKGEEYMENVESVETKRALRSESRGKRGRKRAIEISTHISEIQVIGEVPLMHSVGGSKCR